jgi:hypothetical protein|tara:strand:+ start:2587 stop:3309 length:723 start_codon:yes stop_codon:yes gene_type:complete
MKMNTDNLPAVWVIGFPKSGNTWISYLCSYCFNLPFNNYGDPRSTPARSRIKEKTNGSNSWSSLEGFFSVQKTHRIPENVPYKNGFIIYIIRDPRDVFVSYDFFMKSNNAKIKGRLKYFLIGLFGKRIQIKWFLSNWNRHLKVWKNKTKLIINYDQILDEGVPYLYKKFKFSSIQVSEEIIMDAISYFKFEKMSGGRMAGVENNTSFFRKGISGDWKNYLKDKDSELFRNALKLYNDAVT